MASFGRRESFTWRTAHSVNMPYIKIKVARPIYNKTSVLLTPSFRCFFPRLGLSFFSSIRKMPKSFRVTGRLWRLKYDSPFPDELQITYDQKLHGTILPSSEQNLKGEQLKEVNADIGKNSFLNDRFQFLPFFIWINVNKLSLHF